MDSNISLQCLQLVESFSVWALFTDLNTSVLSILEFNAVLKNIAYTVNNHLLGFNITEDPVLPLNQLLLGPNYDPDHTLASKPEANITVLLPQVQSIAFS